MDHIGLGRIKEIERMLDLETKIDNGVYGPHPTKSDKSSHGQKSIDSMAGKIIRKDYTLDKFTDLNRTTIELYRYEHIAAFMCLAQKHLPGMIGNEIQLFGELVDHPKTGYKGNRISMSHIGGLASEWQLKTKLQAISDDVTHGLLEIGRNVDYVGDLDNTKLFKFSRQLQTLLGYRVNPTRLSQRDKDAVKEAINNLRREVYSILFAQSDFLNSELLIRGTIVALGKGSAENDMSKVEPEVAKIMTDRTWQMNDSGVIVPEKERMSKFEKVYNYSGEQQSKLNFNVSKLFDIYEQNLNRLESKSGLDENSKVKFYTRAYNNAVKQLEGILEGNVDDPSSFFDANFRTFIETIEKLIILPMAEENIVNEFVKKKRASTDDYDKKYNMFVKPQKEILKRQVLEDVKKIKDGTDKS